MLQLQNELQAWMSKEDEKVPKILPVGPDGGEDQQDGTEVVNYTDNPPTSAPQRFYRPGEGDEPEEEGDDGEREKPAVTLNVVDVPRALAQTEEVDTKKQIGQTIPPNYSHEVPAEVKQVTRTTELLRVPGTSLVFTLQEIVGRIAAGERVPAQESMHYELLRFCTFRTYPAQGKPSAMKFAAAGFYYASNNDEVICYCCAKRVSNWREYDDPMSAHLRITPDCKFFTNNELVNVPIGHDVNTDLFARIQGLVNNFDATQNAPRSNTAANSVSRQGADSVADHVAELALDGDSERSSGVETQPQAEEHANITVNTSHASGRNGRIPLSSSTDTDAPYSIPAGNFARPPISSGAFGYNGRRQDEVDVPEMKFQSLPVISSQDHRNNGDNSPKPAIVRKVENQTGVMVSRPDLIPESDTVPVHPSDDAEPETSQQQSQGRIK